MGIVTNTSQLQHGNQAKYALELEPNIDQTTSWELCPRRTREGWVKL
jgi:hypothetical protein